MVKAGSPAEFSDWLKDATTRWGGIIAPREFNPFAWPAIRPADRAPKPAKRASRDEILDAASPSLPKKPAPKSSARPKRSAHPAPSAKRVPHGRIEVEE